MGVCGVEVGAVGFVSVVLILIDVFKHTMDWQGGMFVGGLFACIGIIGVRLIKDSERIKRREPKVVAASLRLFRWLCVLGAIFVLLLLLATCIDNLGRSILVPWAIAVVVGSSVLRTEWLLTCLLDEEDAASVSETPTA